MEELTQRMEGLLKRVTKPESEWGNYQHPCTEPFLIPGIVVDLETFWARGWNHTFIQQIGACPIGMDKPNFEILCDLPVQRFQTVDGMKQWFQDIQLDPVKSIASWKKVLAVRTDQSVVKCLNTSRAWWKTRDTPAFTHQNLLALNNEFTAKTRLPLVFPLEYALKFFLEYAKDSTAWYAHNGNRFDFPILEQNFNRYNMQYSCVPCNENTTAMGPYFRKKFEMPLHFNIIPCYDTMLLMKKHPKSKYYLGKGAKRVSQGVLKGTHNGKYIWGDGSKTKTMYSFKLQDIVNDVGMKANHCTAHTALADCLTLRECLYRVFSTKDAKTMKRIANDYTKRTLHSNILKRLK